MEDSHNWGRLNRWKHWEYRYCGGISPYPQAEKPEQWRFGFLLLTALWHVGAHRSQGYCFRRFATFMPSFIVAHFFYP